MLDLRSFLCYLFLAAALSFKKGFLSHGSTKRGANAGLSGPKAIISELSVDSPRT
jgi:hypothetical protein